MLMIRYRAFHWYLNPFSHFGHENSDPLQAAVKIVIDQHSVVVVDSGNGVEQRRHEIGFCVPDAGSVFPDAVHDFFDVHGCLSLIHI